MPYRQRRTAWWLGAGGGVTLREVELEVEIGAEAPAGSPLTLSETVLLKFVMLTTCCSVEGGESLDNSTNGWTARMRYGSWVRLRRLPSGSLNQAILAPPGAVQIPSGSCVGIP